MTQSSSFVQAPHEEGERPSTPPGRLYVDCALGTTLLGWACSPNLEPASEFILTISRQSAAVKARTFPRADVSDFLGVSQELPLGFSLCLPVQLWDESGQLITRDLALLAAGQSVPINAPNSVSELLSDLDRQQHHPDWSTAVSDLLQQLTPAPRPEWLRGEALVTCQRLAQQIGWPEWPSARVQVCRGHLEQSQGLVWRGWVLGSNIEAEALRLSVNGQTYSAQVIRTDRADVTTAMNSSRRQLGFELELPGSIWHEAQQGGRITLELWAGTLSLCPQGINWTLAHLRQHLIQLYEECSVNPDATAALTSGADHQYEVLLGLEHLLEAGTLLDLPEAARQWFMVQAERYGLGSRTATQRQQPRLDGPQQDVTTVELWHLLRRFNALVADDGHDALDVLTQMCHDRDWGDDTQHRFVCALIPYFCSLDRYEGLRPWISVGELKALASDKSAWSLSLLLPELAWTAHYALARRVMSRLAAMPKGWLNTECVAVAVRRVLERWPAAPRAKAHAAAFVRATLALLEVHATNYWGRSHDLQLTQTAVDLVYFSRRLSGADASAVQTAILRQQAFHPGFWQALKRSWPSTASWPSEFQWAHNRFEGYASAVWTGDLTPTHWVSALCGSATQGCFDAALALRDMVLHAVSAHSTDADAMLQLPSLLSSLSAAETLRLAAHPQSQPAWLNQPSATAQLIRRKASPCNSAQHEWRSSLLRSLWSGQQKHHVDQATDLSLLSSVDHGGIGVILSVLMRALPASKTALASPVSSLSDIRTCWTRLFDETVAHAVPPAALLQAWSLLMRWQSTCSSAGQLQRLIAECRQLACTRYGGDLAAVMEGPAPDQQVLSAPDVLRTSLVIIYSCRKNLLERVEKIKASWGQRLDALGVPWIVAVGEGQGQLEGHLLQLHVPDDYEALPLKTLAMIRWVHDHTDFTHLIKIDDDCHFAVEQFFNHSPHLTHHYLGRRLARGIGGTDRTWHQSKSKSPRAQQSIDKSPEPSEYADGGSGYCLSRFAMNALLKSLEDTAGARLTRSSYMEDKLVGDLLSRKGIKVCEEGFDTLVRRRFGPDPNCVNAYSNTFYPSLASPTMVSHLDDASAVLTVESEVGESSLRPAKLWPSYEAPQLGIEGSNQLELLSPPSTVASLKQAQVIVVAVLRNELLLLPHFLAHYRKLGASRFILVDNLSDDGSRAYLLSQADVVLYSADTEYRMSHFGVAWQQAILAAHALGKWVILADIDEFLIYEGCEDRSLIAWVSDLEHERINAVTTLMVDMYPKGALAEADFQQHPPFECAPYFDRSPLIPWKLGSGCFSNSRTWLSGLRHRLIEDSAPNLYTSQKIAIIKYQPWIRLSEGLHYASNISISKQTAYFAHFKYHAGFAQKVMNEVSRKQHFNDAEEYQRYQAIIAEGSRTLWSVDSLRFSRSTDFRHAFAPEI